MLLKCYTHVRKFGKLSSCHRTRKGQFSFSSQRSAMAVNVQNYCTTVLISHASKVMLKILQARVQQHVNQELADVQAGFRKGRGIRDQISNIHWKKQGNARKISASLTMLKPLTLCTTADCGKFLKGWEYQTTFPVSWETCMWVKKQQLEPDMKQLVQNWERSMTRLYIVTLLI